MSDVIELMMSRLPSRLKFIWEELYLNNLDRDFRFTLNITDKKGHRLKKVYWYQTSDDLELKPEELIDAANIELVLERFGKFEKVYFKLPDICGILEYRKLICSVISTHIHKLNQDIYFSGIDLELQR